MSKTRYPNTKIVGWYDIYMVNCPQICGFFFCYFNKLMSPSCFILVAIARGVSPRLLERFLSAPCSNKIWTASKLVRRHAESGAYLSIPTNRYSQNCSIFQMDCRCSRQWNQNLFVNFDSICCDPTTFWTEFTPSPCKRAVSPCLFCALILAPFFSINFRTFW